MRIRSAAPATPTSPGPPATTWWVIGRGASGTTDVSAAGLGAAGVAGVAGADLSVVGAASPLVAWVTSINETDESTARPFQTTDGGRTWSPMEIAGTGLTGRKGASPAT